MQQQPRLTLDAWLRWLESAHPTEIELGLERVAEVAGRMGLLESRLADRVISVAGTNGKGSTVAMLESLALAHGLSTATYTSPHLLRYNERLRLSGEEASDTALIEGFEAVEAARSADAALQRDEISLTYFEAATLGALYAIRRRQPDLAILEVGLGGRLDAVNVIDADVAVVTTVAQDHASFLGDELEVIGREKAGIMRPERPTVLGSLSLPDSVRQVAAERGAVVYALGEAFAREEEVGGAWRFWGQTPAEALDGLPDPGLPLDNAATALQALSLVGVALEAGACRQALARVRLPGRMQWCGRWCLDVGHNPHAARYLAQRLAGHQAGRSARGRLYGLLGMLADKDAAGVIDALAPVIDAWLPVSLSGPRARQADELAKLLELRGQRVLHQAASPLEGAGWLAARLAPEDRVLVCGSFFTVAEVLGALQNGELGSEDDSPCNDYPCEDAT
ncbi:MAG TPA: bifunctional tetrahydrofolate synthase/dihydrofolate synthase [Halomonas sp.]|nr:bifunctional tetrahydrofolate synthase/dihydrofolate synthase [Halomonas sp.]